MQQQQQLQWQRWRQSHRRWLLVLLPSHKSTAMRSRCITRFAAHPTLTHPSHVSTAGRIWSYTRHLSLLCTHLRHHRRHRLCRFRRQCP